MMNPKIEEILQKDGEILELPVGRSMWPMLINRKDAIVIKKVTEPFKVNDVLFYKRPEKYVLHRLIKIKDGNLIIRGDNCEKNEYDITPEQVYGVLKGFYKGERYIDCETNKLYKFYVWFWRITYYPRRVIKPIYQFARRAVRKILRILKVIK